jgi:hypothetical protein
VRWRKSEVALPDPSMNIPAKIKNALSPKSVPQEEFGLDDLQFFLALLRACPEGSRLCFDQSEPESFVHAFRLWSHRNIPETFEADYYTIDREFIIVAERIVAARQLELDHRFDIVAPDGRSLCCSLDDFMIVTLANDIRQKIQPPRVY